GDTWNIIDGGTITGMFATENLPAAPSLGQVYRVIYQPDRVYVILTCDADLTGDNVLDFFDVSIFLNYFSNQDVRGDLNNDGAFNFFDISLFLQLFNGGCAG
ncbi:MAG: GC-type dockerin domain-anchored protein, partial [Phycisphaerales bacterium]